MRKEPLDSSPFTHAEILLGRSEELLWFEDGSGHRDFLHPLAVEGFCVQGLVDYQFQQTAPDTFELLAEAYAGDVFNQIVLYYHDAQINEEYTRIDTFDATDEFVSAVENNPVLEGWGNQIVRISDEA